MTLRPLRALREINASLSELERADVRAREEARVELTRSATAYSRKAREVVDGTMSLSAVLVRAGEAGEAERLLADAERDVRQEKAVLLESVQEAKVATRHRREKMTRLRLAKMVATAFLAGSVFVFSAMGIAVAKYFSDLVPTAPEAGSSVPEVADGRYEVSPMRRISLALGDMNLELSPEEYDRFRKLMSSSDTEGLRSFLLGIIPSNLAGKLDRALEQAGITTPNKLARLDQTVDAAVDEVRTAAAAPSGSSQPSSGGSGGSQKSSNNDQKKGSDAPDEDDSEPGSTGCEDEGGRDEGEEHNSLAGPLQGCVPLLEDEDSKD